MTRPDQIGDVDISGAAALVRRSRSWMQRHWRELVRDQGFPAPFVGGQDHSPPWWSGALIEAWKTGARFSEPPIADITPPATPANDPRPSRPTQRSRVGALLDAAGGAR